MSVLIQRLRTEAEFYAKSAAENEDDTHSAFQRGVQSGLLLAVAFSRVEEKVLEPTLVDWHDRYNDVVAWLKREERSACALSHDTNLPQSARHGWEARLAAVRDILGKAKRYHA